MEGVLLMDVLSGALVFTRSFTDAFDLRHPRTERMNLSALLSALLSFADNSLHSGDDAATRSSPSIASFATPVERIEFAQTPSKKLLVALFTSPTLDTDVARRASALSLVHRLAYNYEHGNSLETRIAVVLNQGPRLFRDALRRAIEKQVDELLLGFLQHAFNRSDGGPDSKPPPFVLFYFSDHRLHKKLNALGEHQSDDGSITGLSPPATTTAASSGPLGALGFRSPLALGVSSATVSPRHASIPNAETGAAPARVGLMRSHSTMSFRSVFASTRSLFPGPGSRVGGGDGSQQQQQQQRGVGKKTKKKKKNAVMNHVEPQEFQRVVQIPTGPQGAAGSQRPLTGASDARYGAGVGSTDAIALTVVPFVREVVPLFVTSASKSRRLQSQQKAQTAELEHIRWENFPLETPAPTGRAPAPPKKSAAATDLTAWKQGNCLIIYPEHVPSPSSGDATGAKAGSAVLESSRAGAAILSDESARLRRLRDRKAAVVTLFAALEPLAQALVIGRT